MSRELKRTVRSHKSVINDLIDLLPGPIRVSDTNGNHILGEDETTGTVVPITCGDDRVGEVVGGEGCDRVARLLSHLCAKEREKRALAAETLNRYKELTLLYDMSDQFSKRLDLEDVAGLVVEEAQKHLQADGAALLLHQPGATTLEVLAAAGIESDAPRQEAMVGLAGRVFHTGRADVVEADDTGATPGRAVICAPLRSGEVVFGVLRVIKAGESQWTAGHLKLVTALAANAASGIRRAQLHGAQLRDLALRHQVERHLSPHFLDVAFDGAEPGRAAVVFTDLRATAGDPFASADGLLERLDETLILATRALVRHGGTVDRPQEGLLVAAFTGDFAEAATRAVDGAMELCEAVESLIGTRVSVGIVGWNLAPAPAARLVSGINAAAELHTRAGGATLIDYHVAGAVHGVRTCAPAGQHEVAGEARELFEVER